jgi:hypothetical protein
MNWPFEHTFVLNLDRDVERMERMTRRLDRLQIPFERFPAQSKQFSSTEPEIHQPGAFTNAYSHLQIYHEISRRNYRNVLILEDDVVFRDDFGETLSKSWCQTAGVAWDVFHLGLFLTHPGERIGPNVGVVGEGHHLHAYVVKVSSLHKLMHWTNFVLERCDRSWCCLYGDIRRVYADPILAVQEPGWSYTHGAFRDRLPEYAHHFDIADFRAHCEESKSWIDPGLTQSTS